MLVLRRYLGQSIMIGNDIEIKVIKLIDKQVFLGIDAPRDINIARKELHETIKKSKQNQNNGIFLNNSLNHLL